MATDRRIARVGFELVECRVHAGEEIAPRLVRLDRRTIAGMAEEPVLVEVDSRGRVSLGRVARASHRRYLAHEEADGTVVLTPAVVMSELEARFLSNPRLVERVERNRRDPERLVRRQRSVRRSGRTRQT